MSRLRSGHSSFERRSAKWTVDTSFRYNECTRSKLLSSSPETYFHKGKYFQDASTDILVIDTSASQNYGAFIDRIADVLSAGENFPESNGMPSLNDKALYLARQFFREAC